MVLADDSSIKEEVRGMVRSLFRAENGPGGGDPDDYIVSPDNRAETIRGVVDKILADDYLPITRGRGQVDRDREDTLSKVVKGSSSFRRHVGRAQIDVDLFLDDLIAIVRSLLPTTDTTDGRPVEVSFRNMHVFLRRDNRWQCVAWQVTKVQQVT